MLTTMQKRMGLFLSCCLGSRLLISYLAKIASPFALKIMGYIALLPAAGFLYFYYSGSRKTGPEVFGQTIWWNSLRPIHALMYILFSYNAIKGNPYSWVFLFADAVIGVVSFLVHHYAAGDFGKGV